MKVGIEAELCQRVCDWCAPITFRFLETELERDLAYHLRYQEVIAQGWATPDQYPDQREMDEYDVAALQIGGWDGATLIATARVIVPTPECPAPLATALGMDISAANQIPYLGRLVIEPSYRHQPQYLLGLIIFAWEQMGEMGYSDIGGIMTKPMLRLYRMWGIEFDMLADAQDFVGEKRYPCKLNSAKSVPALLQKLPALPS